MGLTQVSTDGVKNDAITKTKIPANQIEASELADNAVDTNAIADQAVALSKLPHGDGSSDGKFLRANNGADPSFETVNTDLVADTSPQLGGDLASNGNNINFVDSTHNTNNRLVFGTGGDFDIFHDGNSKLENANGELISLSDTHRLRSHSTTDDHIKSFNGGAVELFHNGSLRLATDANGIHVTTNVHMNDNGVLELGTSSDLQIYHDGSKSHLKNSTGAIEYSSVDHKFFNAANNSEYARIDADGLKFNGDTAAANALDDYEEGSFVPSINTGFTVTYNTQTGRYTKIGNTVHFSLYIGYNSISGSSNNTNARINGLPFTSGNASLGYGVSVSWIYLLGQDVQHAYVQGSNQYIELLNAPSGGNRNHTNANSCWDAGASYISVAGTYQTA